MYLYIIFELLDVSILRCHPLERTKHAFTTWWRKCHVVICTIRRHGLADQIQTELETTILDTTIMILIIVQPPPMIRPEFKIVYGISHS